MRLGYIEDQMLYMQSVLTVNSVSVIPQQANEKFGDNAGSRQGVTG